MKNVLGNNVVYCKHCKKFIEYTKDEIQKGEDVYYVYGCEENYETYKFVSCPLCDKELRLISLNK